MTVTGTTGTPDGQARDGRSVGQARAVPIVAVAVVVLATGLVGQLTTPYVRRDDWPFLLPRGVPGVADPLDKVSQEGRWLNYAWWWLVGRHGTPVTAVVVLVVAYAVFVVGLWRLFGTGSRVSGALLAAALMVSPVWIRLVYWPGTLSASAVVAAAGVWSLPRAARGRRRLVGWVAVVTVLAVLTYPPVAGILLVAAAVHLRERPWKDLLLVVGAFVVSFGLGVGLAFSIDAAVFGQFGVSIAAWRHPQPLRTPADLWDNLVRYLGGLKALVSALRWPVVVGLVAAAVGLADRRLRPQVLRVGLAVLVVAGLECAQTLATGVRTEVRGSLWAWLACVVPAALLLSGTPVIRRAGQAALAVLVALGVLAWHSDVSAHQATRREYAGIIAAATRTGPPGRDIVLYQDPTQRRTSRGRITVGTLRAMFYEEAGVTPRWCRATECRRLAALAGSGPVHDLGSVVGVVVPAPPQRL